MMEDIIYAAKYGGCDRNEEWIEIVAVQSRGISGIAMYSIIVPVSQIMCGPIRIEKIYNENKGHTLFLIKETYDPDTGPVYCEFEIMKKSLSKYVSGCLENYRRQKRHLL